MSSISHTNGVKSTPPEVLQWIRANAVELKGATAGIGFEDLAPLRDWIGDARLVGIGEATHNTRDFFQLKHRLLEFFVAELGFTIFAIEASFPESLAVNRYVLTGEGDPGAALTDMRFEEWDTDEVLDLIEWMRLWNATHERKIFFYGFDNQSTAPAALFLLEYLRKNDPVIYGKTLPTLQPMAIDADLYGRSKVKRQHAAAALSLVTEMLDSRKARTAEEAYEMGIVRIHVKLLQQREEFPDGSFERQWNIRDRGMAQNVAALLGLHGPMARALVWAHNGHIGLRDTGQFGITVRSMGDNLREMFGKNYFTFGFTFDNGSFGAADKTGRMRTCSVPPAPAGTLSAAFAAAGPPLFAIDLRHTSGSVKRWLGTGPAMRNIGGTYHAGIEDSSWNHADVTALFDAMLFVRETTAAHRRPTALPSPRDEFPQAHGFVNLDFTDVVSGRAGGWTLPVQAPRCAYDATVVRENDRQFLEISRLDCGWPWGNFAVSQAVSAEAWRGKTLVIRCPASVEGGHDGSSAQLGVRLGRVREDHPGGEEEHHNAWEARHTWQRVATNSDQTTELLLEVTVGDAIGTVELALVMTGDGRARFGPVTAVTTR